jgi:hypothetical protein
MPKALAITAGLIQISKTFAQVSSGLGESREIAGLGFTAQSGVSLVKASTTMWTPFEQKKRRSGSRASPKFKITTYRFFSRAFSITSRET